MSLHDAKIKEIYRVLVECKGNRTHAAKVLGVSLRSVRIWINRFDQLAGFRIEMKKGYLLGVVSALFLVGCAGFSYHYYGLADVSYEHGTLLGPKEKDDLPFSKCAPNGESKHPCVIMFTKDFMAFKLDYLDTQQKLKECQKGK